MEFGAKSELNERDEIGDVKKRFRLFMNNKEGVWTAQITMIWKGLWRSPGIVFTWKCLYLLKIEDGCAG